MSLIKKFQNWYDENKYYALFASIGLLILTPPFLYERPILSYVIYLLISIVIVNCLIIISGHPPRILRGIIIGIAVLAFIWVNFLHPEYNPTLELISNGLLAAIFALTISKLIREIFRLETVSGQVVIGAIATYLLLGLMGAFLFDVIEILYPNSFNAPKVYTGFYSEIYLSFITISTLGYGDITPVTPQAQAAAIFVSISGQLYLAILMAMLVGKFLKDTDW